MRGFVIAEPTHIGAANLARAIDSNKPMSKNTPEPATTDVPQPQPSETLGFPRPADSIQSEVKQ